MKKFWTWFHESNRNKHFFYAIPAAFIGTLLFAVGLAFGMEYKDKLYGNKFDWTDLWMTIAGGTIGQILQLLVILIILILI